MRDSCCTAPRSAPARSRPSTRPQLGHGAALLTAPLVPGRLARRGHPGPAQGRRTLDVDHAAQQHRPRPLPARLRRRGPRPRRLVLGARAHAARPDRDDRVHGRPAAPRPALVTHPARTGRRRPAAGPVRALPARDAGGDAMTTTSAPPRAAGLLRGPGHPGRLRRTAPPPPGPRARRRARPARALPRHGRRHRLRRRTGRGHRGAAPRGPPHRRRRLVPGRPQAGQGPHPGRGAR